MRFLNYFAREYHRSWYVKEIKKEECKNLGNHSKGYFEILRCNNETIEGCGSDFSKFPKACNIDKNAILIKIVKNEVLKRNKIIDKILESQCNFILIHLQFDSSSLFKNIQNNQR